MSNCYSLLLPILIPIIGGLAVILLPALKEKKPRQILVTAVILITTLLTLVDLSGSKELLLLKLTDNAAIYFKVDTISRIFSILICVMWLMSGVFSFEYMNHEKNHERYYCFYLISLGTLIGLAFAGNYLTMYMLFEWMTLMTMPMVLHSGTKESIQAAIKYLLYSITGASLGLLGIPLILHFGTTLNFVPGGVLDMAVVHGHEGLVLGITFAVVIGFGAKAGMYPLYAWLPTAHPVAPAPASAVLSGVITKAGVLAIIRVIYYQIGTSFLVGTWVQTGWVIIALTTVFMGSTLALKENIIKKRMAYSTVSQVSYILFGLFLMNPTAMTGSLLHILGHSICKDILFLSAGAIIYKTHKTNVSELRGIGKEMPIVMWCFTIASLGLVGIPPLCGFLSKWYLCFGSFESGLPVLSWLGPIVLIISAILTAGYLLSITIMGFFPGADYDYSALKSKEPSILMTAPLVILAVSAFFTVYPKPFMNLINEIISVLF